MEDYDFASLPSRVQDELLHFRSAARHAAAVAAGTSAPAYSSWRLSFTHGLLVGQLTVIIMMVFFLKFFIFAEVPTGKGSGASSPGSGAGLLSSAAGSGLDSLGVGATAAAGFLDRRLRKKKSRILRGPSPLTATQILSKTYYNTSSHRAESLDWFNVLVAQALAQFRDDAQSKDAILHSLDAILNGERKPDFLGPIHITEINMGDEFPIFSRCRIDLVNDDGSVTGQDPLGASPARKVSTSVAGGISAATGSTGAAPGNNPSGGPAGSGANANSNATNTSSAANAAAAADKRLLHATMDIDFSDQITLAVETSLLLNFPSKAFATLPVALGVTICRFSGTLSVSIIRPIDPDSSSSPPLFTSPDGKSGPASTTSMTFSLQPDFELDLQIRSLIGSRSRLQDIPKIAQLVESGLRRWIEERCVTPRYQRIDIPSLWPSKTRTRDATDAKSAASINGDSTGAPPPSSSSAPSEKPLSQTTTLHPPPATPLRARTPLLGKSGTPGGGDSIRWASDARMQGQSGSEAIRSPTPDIQSTSTENQPASARPPPQQQHNIIGSMPGAFTSSSSLRRTASSSGGSAAGEVRRRDV